jgi:hypothetical protein
VVDEMEITNVDVLATRWARAPKRRFDVAMARALGPPDRARALLAKGPPADRYIIFAGAKEELVGAVWQSSVVDRASGFLIVETTVSEYGA